jgi:sugar lactone lactonase YvrE
MQPELILDAHTDLGEGPAWDMTANRLTWVDIRAGDLHIYRPQENTNVPISLGEPVGCAAPCQNGDLIVGLKSGFATYNLSTNALTRLVNPEPHLQGNRFNDGKCDPDGRFLAGTMDVAEEEASGSLYSYSPQGMLKTLLTEVRISNGLTWSPDSKTFYFIDTPTRQVTAFDYDLPSGSITNPRPVVTVPPGLGWPDGMTSDAEGMLWVAMWGGAKLTRWNPATGQLLESIPFPALNISACIFGGKNLTDLYITSARKGMSSDQLTAYPFSGGLFRLQTNIQGMPTYKFAG